MVKCETHSFSKLLNFAMTITYMNQYLSYTPSMTMRNISLKNKDIIYLKWQLKFVLTGFAEITQAFISLYLDLGNSLFAYLLFSILPHFNVFATQNFGTPFQYLYFQVLEATVSGTTPIPFSVQEVQVSMALFTPF